MVTLDVDYPDIETYIDWKVIEEQKVAALVAGSKLAQKHLGAVMRACTATQDEDRAAYAISEAAPPPSDPSRAPDAIIASRGGRSIDF